MCGTRRDFVAKGAKRCSIRHAAAGPRKALVNSRTVEHAEERYGDIRHVVCSAGSACRFMATALFPCYHDRKKEMRAFCSFALRKIGYSFNYQLTHVPTILE